MSGDSPTSQMDETLARAALTERERRVLSRLLAYLREELGDDLLAIWLYGSRARGEADLEETDPDRRSDIDLMIVVDPSSGWTTYNNDFHALASRAADAEGDSPVWYSPVIWDSEWLRNRREIRSFFVQEVDRDKMVLHGSTLE